MRYDSDKYLEITDEVLDICNSVIPEVVSDKFDKLWRLFSQYNINLLYLYEKEDSFNSFLGDNSKCIECRKEIFELKNQISELLKEKKLNYSEIGNLYLKIADLEDEIGDDYKKFDDQYVNGSSKLSEIVVSVTQGLNEMKKTLDEIGSIDGFSKLDILKVEDRHIRKIDKIPYLSNWKKDDMKRWLPIYLNLKMSFYKSVYEFSTMTIDAYKRGEPLLLFDFSMMENLGKSNNDLIRYVEELNLKYKVINYLGDSLLLPKLYLNKDDKKTLIISKSYGDRFYSLFNFAQINNLMFDLTFSDDYLICSFKGKNDVFCNCLAMGKVMEFLNTGKKLSFEDILNDENCNDARLIRTDGLYFAGHYLEYVRKQESEKNSQDIIKGTSRLLKNKWLSKNK